MERFLLLGVLAALLTVATAQVFPQTPQRNCSIFKTCETCITEGKNNTNFQDLVGCLWCGSEGPTGTCKQFGVTSVIPLNGVECPEYKYNVGTCTINALTVIIIIAVVCFLFVVLVTCVCCCCCIWCARRRKRKQIIEENRYLDEKENIKQRSAERRAERKAKHDEIRRKYGLYNEDQSAGSYKKLDS